MSTVSGTSNATTAAGSAAASTAASNTALQQAAQSIISGSTGNSSMDVSSLVTALVNAKTAGQTAALTAQQTSDNTTISAYGTLSAGLSALQASLTSLSNGNTLNAFKASASGNGLTATAASGAVAGSYAIDVKQIAAAQVLTSSGYSATQALASGPSTLTLSVGGASTTISLDSSNSTVAGIASAINAASNNPGVTATVVNGTDGAHLVLHATATGSANTIGVSISDSNSGDALNQLAVQSNAGTSLSGTSNATSAQLAANQSSLPSGTTNWSQTTAAQDAYFTIDGTAVANATNTVTSALSGVTLNLTAAAVDSTGTSPQTLTIAQDTGSQSTAINNFVNLYNTLVTTMGTLSSFSSGATTQGSQ